MLRDRPQDSNHQNVVGFISDDDAEDGDDESQEEINKFFALSLGSPVGAREGPLSTEEFECVVKGISEWRIIPPMSLPLFQGRNEMLESAIN